MPDRGRGPSLKPVDADEIEARVTEFRGRMDQGARSALRWAVGHPGRAFTVARWVRGLPRTTIKPAGDRSGWVLHRRFGGIGPLRTGRHGQAALVLPDSVDQYWRGPKRKVFRNKMAGAGRAGLSWRMLAPAETAGATQAVCDALGWDRDVRTEMERLLEVPLESSMASAAFSSDGSVLAVCLAVASGDVAQIRWGMSVGRGPSRWAAFAALLHGAHAAGVTTLLVGPMVGRDSEDEYFQRRIGFEPSNIAVSNHRSPAGVVGRWPWQLARARRWTDDRARRRGQGAPGSGRYGRGPGRGPVVVLALLVGAAALAAAGTG
jgi:hypothetical protein